MTKKHNYSKLHYIGLNFTCGTYFPLSVIMPNFVQVVVYETTFSSPVLHISVEFTDSFIIAPVYVQYAPRRQMCTEYMFAPAPITRLIKLPNASIASGANEVQVVIAEGWIIIAIQTHPISARHRYIALFCHFFKIWYTFGDCEEQ